MHGNDNQGHGFDLPRAVCNITTCPVASKFGKKTAMGQAEQDPDLPRSASNVLDKVLFNTVARKVKVPSRQVNFRGSLRKECFATYVAPCRGICP